MTADELAARRRRNWGDLGGRGLVLRTRPDADLYVIWSVRADGPMWIGPEAELVEVLGAEHADRLDRARVTGTSSALGEGGWDYSGFVADQLGWLPRARLHDYIVAYQSEDADATRALLDPFETDDPEPEPAGALREFLDQAAARREEPAEPDDIGEILAKYGGPPGGFDARIDGGAF